MKKLILFSLLAVAFLSLLSAKTKLTIKNTLGAEMDELGDYDLFSWSKETDINGDTISSSIFSLGDEFQIDLDSDKWDGRFRLDLLYTNASDAVSPVILAPSGFIKFSPISNISFLFGNNFYKQFAIPSAYLAADDNTTKYGRLLTDSLGADNYSTAGNISLYTNGFCGGAAGNWNFYLGSYNTYIKAAGGATFSGASGSFESAVDFGLNAGLSNLLDFGFTAHDVFNDDRKFGAFAGLTAIPNLILNAGFYYNFTSSDYLPETRVERNDESEFKKQKTKYALGLTGGYRFNSIGLGIYADFISGLTNEYIGEIKYYDASGNLIKTVTTTIVRGETVVKYKNGVAKRTDEYPARTIPYYGQLRLTYDINDSLDFAFNFKLRSMINDPEDTWITLYPRITIDLADDGGKIGLGLHLDFNLTRYEGLSNISIPFTYTYKFKTKF